MMADLDAKEKIIPPMLPEEEEELEDDGCGGKRKKMKVMPDEKKKDAIRAQRYDVYEDDENYKFKETPEGYMAGRAVVTNIGVFMYPNADGTVVRELRRPEDVFALPSMMSLRGKPVTNEHPLEKVDVNNVKKYAVGMTEGNPEFDSYHVSIGMVITDANTIAEIKKGKRGLSCGYDCELLKADEGAMYLGMPYDYVQTDIKYNHVSLCEKGRAGDAARMRVDSASDNCLITTHRRDMRMDELRTINLDGADYKAEDKVIEALKAANSRADGLQAQLDTYSAEKSTLEGERDSLKEKCDASLKEIEELKVKNADEAVIAQRVKDRITLLDVAKSVKVEVTDAMSDMDIKIAVIKAKSPGAKLDGKNEFYVQARFDCIIEDKSVDASAEADAGIRVLNSVNTDSAVVDAKAKREAMITRMKSGK
jgi:hypothetical protein